MATERLPANVDTFITNGKQPIADSNGMLTHSFAWRWWHAAAHVCRSNLSNVFGSNFYCHNRNMWAMNATARSTIRCV